MPEERVRCIEAHATLYVRCLSEGAKPLSGAAPTISATLRISAGGCLLSILRAGQLRPGPPPPWPTSDRYAFVIDFRYVVKLFLHRVGLRVAFAARRTPTGWIGRY